MDQELVREDVGLEAGPIRHTRRFGNPDLDHLARVVPLIDGRRHVQTLVTLESDQAPLESRGQDLAHLGLADPGLSLEEEWPPQTQRQVDGRSERPVRYITLLLEKSESLID